MEVVWKLAVAAVIAALLALLLKKDAPELALLLVLAAAVAMVVGLSAALSSVLSFLGTLAELAGVSPAVLAPLLKTLAIAVVCRLAADVCRDAGQSMLASAVELGGGVTTVCVAIPLIRTALDMVLALI